MYAEVTATMPRPSTASSGATSRLWRRTRLSWPCQLLVGYAILSPPHWLALCGCTAVWTGQVDTRQVIHRSGTTTGGAGSGKALLPLQPPAPALHWACWAFL